MQNVAALLDFARSAASNRDALALVEITKQMARASDGHSLGLRISFFPMHRLVGAANGLAHHADRMTECEIGDAWSRVDSILRPGSDLEERVAYMMRKAA